MPVIVIGADTAIGNAVVRALSGRSGEVRAFVSTPEVLDDLRARGVKAALGDVSDGSHVGGAALNAFAAVLVAEAACDERERAFADDAPSVHAQWAAGLADAGVTRAIWVGAEPIPQIIAAAVRESVSVVVDEDGDLATAAEAVARYDEAAHLP